MTAMSSLRPKRAPGFLLCALALVLALPAGADARPRCGGKKATIVGGPGDNRIKVPKHGVQVIHGGGGNDTIIAMRNKDRVCGGRGNDRLLAGPGRDKSFGGPGNDYMELGLGGDKARGGAGSDTILGGSGGDKIRGGGGSDRILGGIQDDKLAGGGGVDLVGGGQGIDRLRGNGGGDWLRGDTNTDKYDGGPGSDTLSFATATPPGPFGLDGVTASLRNGTAHGDDANERLRRIENLVGSMFDDNLQGRGGGFVRGGLGNDSCSGFASEDCDNQTPGGSFVMIADPGSPDPGLVIMGGSSGTSWTISGSGGRLRVSGSPLSTGAACERSGDEAVCSTSRSIGYILAWGSGGGDTVRAKGLPGTALIKFDGGLGDDALIGGGTDDLLYAGEGGADLLKGGGGDDALVSRPGGSDRLFGGGGNDQLVTDSPCGGHLYSGGGGNADVAGFGHVQSTGVKARLGGKSRLRRGGACDPTRIRGSSEVLEGTRFKDVLIAQGRNDLLIGREGNDRCVGGRPKNC
jgi:Ca2+-binding RTX toxin-like protein